MCFGDLRNSVWPNFIVYNSRSLAILTTYYGVFNIYSLETVARLDPISQYRTLWHSMSTDKLTQLQAEFNQLLIQFFSVYSYNAQRHPLEPPAAIPGLAFTALKQTEPGPEDTDPTKTAYPLQPVDQKTFDEAQEELAEDLVLKTQQIQRLIADLPGIDQDQSQQAEVIRKLVGEVEDMDKATRAKRREMRQLVKRLDALLGGMSTSIDYSQSNGH